MTPDQLRECPIDQCAENTDREIYRGPDEGCGDYYSDSLHITQEGALGIDCGGYVIVRPIRAWHGIAKAHAAALEEVDLLKDGESLMMRYAQKWKERAVRAESALADAELKGREQGMREAAELIGAEAARLGRLGSERPADSPSRDRCFARARTAEYIRDDILAAIEGKEG